MFLPTREDDFCSVVRVEDQTKSWDEKEAQKGTTSMSGWEGTVGSRLGLGNAIGKDLQRDCRQASQSLPQTLLGLPLWYPVHWFHRVRSVCSRQMRLLQFAPPRKYLGGSRDPGWELSRTFRGDGSRDRSLLVWVYFKQNLQLCVGENSLCPWWLLWLVMYGENSGRGCRLQFRGFGEMIGSPQVARSTCERVRTPRPFPAGFCHCPHIGLCSV